MILEDTGYMARVAFIIHSIAVLSKFIWTRKWNNVHILPLGEPSSPSAQAKNMPAEHPSEYGHPLYVRKVELS